MFIYLFWEKERAQMSINWWMDKEGVVYTYNGILLGNEKEWNHAICSNVDGTGRYAEWNKSVRERQISYVFTHVDLEKLNGRPWGKGRGKNRYKQRERGKPQETIKYRKQIIQFKNGNKILRIHIRVKTYGICLSLPNLFHLA